MSAHQTTLDWEIRRAANRYLLEVFSRVRKAAGDAPTTLFGPKDRILDVGCGAPEYFQDRWKSLAKEGLFSQEAPPRVVGIDKKYGASKDGLLKHLMFNPGGGGGDYYEHTSDEKYTVVYSSFCQPWLLSIPNGNTKEQVDQRFFEQLRGLLRDEGYFIAVSTYGDDNFPTYTRIILECLRRIGYPKTYEEYVNQKTEPSGKGPHIRNIAEDSLKQTADQWERQEFANLALFRSLEWIPLKRDGQFFEFWESGGKDLMKRILGNDGAYERFRNEFQEILRNNAELKKLNIQTHDIGGGEYIFLPSHMYYQVSRFTHQKNYVSLKCCPSAYASSQNRPSMNEVLSSLERASALLNDKRLDIILSKKNPPKKHVSRFLDPVLAVLDNRAALNPRNVAGGGADKNTRLVYAAFVEAGGPKKQGVELSYYSRKYKRRAGVVEQGKTLGLPTLTPALLSNKGGCVGEDMPSALFLAIQERDGDDSSCMFHFGCPDSPRNPSVPAQVLELPRGALLRLFDNLTLKPGKKDCHPLRDEKEDILAPLLPPGESGRLEWARLLFAADEAERVLTATVEQSGRGKPREFLDWENVLRYYIWQAQVGAPAPVSMVIAPRRNPALVKDTGASRTGFVAWLTDGKSLCEGYECARALAPILSILLSRSLVREARDKGLAEGIVEGRDQQREAFAHDIKSFIISLPEWLSAAEGELTKHDIPGAQKAIQISKGMASAIHGFYNLTYLGESIDQLIVPEAICIGDLLHESCIMAGREIRKRLSMPSHILGAEWSSLPPERQRSFCRRIAQDTTNIGFLASALRETISSFSHVHMHTFSRTWCHCVFNTLIAQSIRHAYAVYLLQPDNLSEPQKLSAFICFSHDLTKRIVTCKNSCISHFDPEKTHSWGTLNTLNRFKHQRVEWKVNKDDRTSQTTVFFTGSTPS